VHAVVGPIVTRDGGYAYDCWTPAKGLERGYAYRRIDDAYYARNVEIRAGAGDHAGRALACGTIDEFTSAVAERRIPPPALRARSPRDYPWIDRTA
jgi:hypothetical protein